MATVTGLESSITSTWEEYSKSVTTGRLQPEPVQLLPKDLLEYAESGDRSSLWLEIAETDTHSASSLGNALTQASQAQNIMQQFSGSSFMSSAAMSQLGQLGNQLGKIR